MEGGRKTVDYNQNARDRTIASAYSVRPRPGAPVSALIEWSELPDIAPLDFTVKTMEASHGLGICITRLMMLRTTWRRFLRCTNGMNATWVRRDAYPPDYPKMAGNHCVFQPSRKASQMTSANVPDQGHLISRDAAGFSPMLAKPAKAIPLGMHHGGNGRLSARSSPRRR